MHYVIVSVVLLHIVYLRQRDGPRTSVLYGDSTIIWRCAYFRNPLPVIGFQSSVPLVACAPSSLRAQELEHGGPTQHAPGKRKTSELPFSAMWAYAAAAVGSSCERALTQRRRL